MCPFFPAFFLSSFYVSFLSLNHPFVYLDIAIIYLFPYPYFYFVDTCCKEAYSAIHWIVQCFSNINFVIWGNMFLSFCIIHFLKRTPVMFIFKNILDTQALVSSRLVKRNWAPVPAELCACLSTVYTVASWVT